MKKAGSLFILMAMFMALVSCDKSNDPSGPAPDMETSKDLILAESLFAEIKDMSDDAVSSLEGQKSTMTPYLGPCAEITIDNQDTLFVLTVDFGDENCLGNDGRYRRGKIINTYSGAYWQEETVITHETEDYFVNDNEVIVSKTVTNQGADEDGYPTFTIEENGSIVLAETGDTITRTAFRERKWVEGYDTFRRLDDVYHITGNASGKDRLGRDYESEITTPLRREVTCQHFVSGVRTTTMEELPTRTLDYGDGECDNVATLIIDDQEFTITLP
ncbi:MAG: hypothetical protein ACOCQ6_02220, partial [Bacteroidota bacterium]